MKNEQINLRHNLAFDMCLKKQNGNKLWTIYIKVNMTSKYALT